MAEHARRRSCMIGFAGMLGFAGTYLPWSARRPAPRVVSSFAGAETAPQTSYETAKNGSTVEIRRVLDLSPAQLQEVTALLARSFDDTTLFQVAFPDPALRNRMLQVLFTTIVKDAMRFGRVELACNHQVVGAVIWYLPGRYP